MSERLPRLAHDFAITDEKRYPSWAFQRWWQKVVEVLAGTRGDVDDLQVQVPLPVQQANEDFTPPAPPAPERVDFLGLERPPIQPVFEEIAAEDVSVDPPSGTTATDVQASVEEIWVTLLAFADAFQPKDSDLTAIAALSTTSFGRALLALADAAALRTAAALGSAAVENVGTSGGTVPKLNGGNTWSALQDYSATIRATSGFGAGSGSGLELYFNGGEGYIASFNRTGSVGLPLNIFSTSAKFHFAGTTASAANAFLDAADGNNLLRSTSSRRYKRDIEPVNPAFNRVLDLTPVWYRSKAERDNQEWGWWGLVAEDVAKIDPRLVHYAYAPSSLKKNGKPRKGAKLRPDGVQYERLSVLLLDEVKRLEKRVEALEKA